MFAVSIGYIRLISERCKRLLKIYRFIQSIDGIKIYNRIEILHFKDIAKFKIITIILDIKLLPTTL